MRVMMTYDETEVAGDVGRLVDREALLSELVAAIHTRIVRHYRLIRVLSDAGGYGGVADRMAARAAEAEDISLLVLEWMRDPEALDRWRGQPEERIDGD